MYTGWVMSIEDKEIKVSRPDTICVVIMCTVLVTLPRLGQIYYGCDDSRTLQYTPILTGYMINFF